MINKNAIFNDAGFSPVKKLIWGIGAFFIVFSSACSTPGNQGYSAGKSEAEARSSNRFLVVDCLLPGQVKKLGSNLTYLTQRRPVKTSASDCEIRGGEYVSYDRANYATALKIWLPLAKGGDPKAQNYVGEIYEKGLGLTPDYEVAAHWYQKAVEQNYSRAQLNLGHLYEQGLGVQKSQQKALNLYRMASGIKGDELLFASTLNSTHVTKKSYEIVQSQLVEQQRVSDRLRAQLSTAKTSLSDHTLALNMAEKQLRATEDRLESLTRETAGRSRDPGQASLEERELAAQMEQLGSRKESLEREVNQLRAKNLQLEARQERLNAQLLLSEREKSSQEHELQETQKQLEQYKSRIAESASELVTLEKQLDTQLAREAELAPALAGLQQGLKSKSDDLKKAQAKYRSVEAEKLALEEQLSEAQSTQTGYQDRLELLQKQLVAVGTELARSEGEAQVLRKQLEDGSTREQVLADLRQQLLLNREDRETQRREYAAIEAETQELRQQLLAEDQRRSAYQDRVANTELQLKSSQQQLSRAEQQVAALRQELHSLRSREATLSPALVKLEAELEAKNRDLAEHQKRFARLEASTKVRYERLVETLNGLVDKSNRVAALNKQYKQEKESLGGELAVLTQKLEQTSHQLLVTKASLKMETESKREALAEQSEEHRLASLRQREEIANLTKDLKKQFALVGDQKMEIVRLEGLTRQYSDELESLKSAPEMPLYAANVAPVIEIIEPPVVVTRSEPVVRMRLNQTQHQVVGKAIAPEGLLSLNVNGAAVELTENNLFKTAVEIQGDRTPVEVVAIDRSGRRAAVTFAFLKQGGGPKAKTDESEVADARGKSSGKKLKVAMGDYYALIIGNNEYRQFSTLTTAVNDAQETEKILRDKYHFKTKLLVNANRYTILSALNDLREQLDENDNLLIYYAGHGKLDEVNKRGYWLPVDAEANNNANWISNTALTDILNAMEAKHILVVADSCYSGTLSQTPIARVESNIPEDIREQWVKVMAETRARITLTSGGVEPVIDSGGGDHSIFATAFLNVLRSNDELLEGYALYHQVLEKMNASAESGSSQVPQYAPIHLAGHEAGEFFFSPASI